MRAGASEGGELRNSRYLFWGLAAVELFMSFSFLGYVHTEPISIAFVFVPVLAAGYLMGVRALHALLVYSFMGGAVPGTGFWPREYGQ